MDDIKDRKKIDEKEKNLLTAKHVIGLHTEPDVSDTIKCHKCEEGALVWSPKLSVCIRIRNCIYIPT